MNAGYYVQIATGRCIGIIKEYNMSWGGSPSCGFDLVKSDGSEYLPERRKRKKKERLLNWLECFYLTARHRDTPENDDARSSGAVRAYKEIKQLIMDLPKEQGE